MSKREDILLRLENLVKDVDGVTSVLRNSLQVPEVRAEECVVLILDGDENVLEGQYQNNRRPSNMPVKIAMLPELYVIVQSDPSTVGPHLSLMRDRIKYAVVNDVPLLALSADGNGVQYEGLQTALALGRSMAGEMGMNFTILYFDKNERPTETPTG